jgi:imidazole glycerol-phosphate synthase subunit HisH
MIVIADYGLGNISSVRNMLAKVGCTDVEMTADADKIAAARKLVLPGVGAFDHGMSCLNASGNVDALNEAVMRRGVPTLGICLGMQLMGKGSEEGAIPGLGWIDAHAVRFSPSADSTLKVPHMGWNTIQVRKHSALFDDGGADERRFYFVHSYHVCCRDDADVLATAHHGVDFTAAFCHDNLYGVQFHPEKSHRFGMDLMSRFVGLPC